jgi:hypothetical protein
VVDSNRDAYTAMKIKDYGSPELSKDFFDKNPVKNLSAASITSPNTSKTSVPNTIWNCHKKLLF